MTLHLRVPSYRDFLEGKIFERCQVNPAILGIQLLEGDCIQAMHGLGENSVDSIVTDPPYGLEFMGKGWDGADGFRRSLNIADAGRDSVFGRQSSRGPEYRAGSLFQEFSHAWACEAFRVLKPGGHLLAFGGTRTQHRMVCAIEDAGFEIRDMTAWLYGSGFPKSLDVSKAIDRALGAERSKVRIAPAKNPPNLVGGVDKGGDRPWRNVAVAQGFHEAVSDEAVSDEAVNWQGWGTALKPAFEPVVLARKPLSEATVAANVLKWGTGAINVDACRVEAPEGLTNGGSPSGDSDPRTERGNGHALGRWPANVIHDGSEEVVAAFPDAPGQLRAVKGDEASVPGYSGGLGRSPSSEPRGDSGSAARFFYSAKADSDDRLGSKHPTVKPVDLMQWLVRLVTPKGGLVLDPFAGTGTTGEAAFREGMRAVLIEREPQYIADIQRRLALLQAGPNERSHAIIKAKGLSADPGPLFESRSA